MIPAASEFPKQRALITGGAKRIGRALTLALAEDGWAVAIHYNGGADEAAATAQAAQDRGAPSCATLQADLTQEAETTTLVERAAAALGGPLTLLINNAAIFERDEAHDATRAGWDRHIEANLRAPFVLSQHFAAQVPALDAGASEPEATGLIINMLDQRVWSLTPHFTSYTVSKAGLWTLTQTLAMAFGPQIRVCGVGPGPTIATPSQSDEHFARQRAGTPLQRGADATDVVAALRYLLSARSVTGQMIALDGGQHLNWRP